MPHTPLKKLFEKSFLRIFKNLLKKGKEILYTDRDTASAELICCSRITSFSKGI